MAEHTLYRNGSSDMGTFGLLMVGDQSWFTVERPWENNQRRISCIPCGDYVLVNHSSPKHPKTFALVNEKLGVFHYPHPEAKRDAILIHVANVATDVEGCIGLGKRLGALYGKWAVLASNLAVQEALPLMKAGDILHITENQWSW